MNLEKNQEHKRFFYIETVGCQMNILDSELMAAGLLQAGFSAVSDKMQADVILFNTCSVREHAEEKIYSALGRLKAWKSESPTRILGVTGCMAQKDQKEIFKRAPYVDLVVGPGQLEHLPEILGVLYREKAGIDVPFAPLSGDSLNTFNDPLGENASGEVPDNVSENTAEICSQDDAVNDSNVFSDGTNVQNTLPNSDAHQFLISLGKKSRKKGKEKSPEPTGFLAVSLNRFDKKNSYDEVRRSFHQYDPTRRSDARRTPFQAMVRVMLGCDRLCSYCIVPAVRGPEQSRPFEEIVSEVEKLASQGCVEVTLIGQTVNSYRYKDGNKTYRLADLLERIERISGIRRIRFLTSYPVGMTDELLQAVRDLPKVAPYIHVPAQHGADSVLKRMRRQYTVAEYDDLVRRIYETVPDASITSDFIVGFCGETEEEFQKTMELVRRSRFKNSFIFKYSVRTGTKAAELYQDDISEEIKRRRNNELLTVQNEICAEQNRELVGQTVEILVEGPVKSPFSQNSDLQNSDSQNDTKKEWHFSWEKPETELKKRDLTLSMFPDRMSGTRFCSSEKNELSMVGDESALKKEPTLEKETTLEKESVLAKETAIGKTLMVGKDWVQLTGRTASDRIVVFDGPLSLVGTFVRLEILVAAPFTLFGILKEQV